MKTVLGGWRGSLLDMGGRNRLLNFRHTRTATLEITSPDAAAVLHGLARGWDFALLEEREDDGDGGHEEAAQEALFLPENRGAIPTGGLITQKTRPTALHGALRLLRNKSSQMYNDYGLWVLWLGVGMLDWREVGAQETSSAPLLLVPVELRRDGRTGQARLYPAEGQEPVHNPALEVKCDRLGIDWSPVTSNDVAELGPVLTAARHIADGQEGWSVDERVVLGLFASYKEAVYQDLQQNEDRILAHPLVRAVALGPDAELPSTSLSSSPPNSTVSTRSSSRSGPLSSSTPTRPSASASLRPRRALLCDERPARNGQESDHHQHDRSADARGPYGALRQ
ncbi:DUF4011 domain-containing protein [Streptomyces antimycoticus]|uniref:DUF4011 domain-containing protein n=1 Tax=Streptomyces antimycoticus TaxID=68175 RepID=UPI0036B8F992